MPIHRKHLLAEAVIGGIGALAVALLVLSARKQEATSIRGIFETSSREHARALQDRVGDAVNGEFPGLAPGIIIITV